MKREGRQHGMVRTFRVLPDPLNPRPGGRHVNKFDSPPTAGLFTKVATKPTNHSKFTGKCGKPRCTECHIHPASKAKDKTKGNHKLKSSDVLSNHRLVTWRVVDSRPRLNVSGFSATGILDHLSTRDYDGLNFSGFSATGILDHLSTRDYDNNNNDDDDEDDEISAYASAAYDNRNDHDHDVRVDFDEVEKDGNYEEMGFFNVEYVIDPMEEDEGWCLVPQT